MKRMISYSQFDYIRTLIDQIYFVSRTKSAILTDGSLKL